MSSSSLLELSGTLTIAEPIPTGAVATIKIVDTDGEVHAATAVEATENGLTWSVTIDSAAVTDPSRLLVWAALRTDAGWWGTLDLQPIGPQIALARVPH